MGTKINIHELYQIKYLFSTEKLPNRIKAQYTPKKAGFSPQNPSQFVHSTEQKLKVIQTGRIEQALSNGHSYSAIR